jgi:CSLREA domain-containing protein
MAQVGGLMLAAGAAGTAQAASITVNSNADNATGGNAQCTLREALNNANANADTTGGDCVAGSGADTIQFSLPNPSTITLGGTQLSVTDSVTISGPGAAALTISGNNASRIFYVYNNSQALAVTVSGLTLTQGTDPIGAALSSKGEDVTLSSVTASGNTGDAISVTSGVVSGSLTLTNSTVTGTTAGRGVRAHHLNSVTFTGSTLSNNNTTLKGGGAFLYRINTVAVDNVTVSGNTATGRAGGLFLYDINGPVTISNSRVTGNQSGNRGGGIVFYKPLDDVTIQDTTISGNTAVNRGGGIFFYKQSAGKTMTIRRTTISGNTAGGTFGGGGIFFYKQSGTTLIENSTISGNTANRGGGVYDDTVQGGVLNIRSSTIAGNTATVDGGNAKLTSFPSVTIRNSILADGTAPAGADLLTGASNVQVNFSLVESTNGTTFAGGSGNNVTGSDPALGPLQNNGGSTQTRLPGATSPVINAGDPAFVPPPTTDQRGLPRVVGAATDMGSVEVNGGTIVLSSATYSVNESAGTVTITINRTGGTDPATVNYATSNGTAVAPGDYTTTNGTATFAAGATSASFVVPILNDAIYEGPESFTVTISAPSVGATLGSPATAAVNIVDDDIAVPALGVLGKILLAITSALVGLFALKRQE